MGTANERHHGFAVVLFLLHVARRRQRDRGASSKTACSYLCAEVAGTLGYIMASQQ